MGVRLHNDVLQLIAQVLFDGGLVVLFHLGVICQDAHGAKILPAAAFIGSEKFLHRIGSVGAVVKDLGERPMARTNARERVAENICLLRAGLALRLGRSKAGVLLGSFLDRLIDFTALALLAGVGALLVPGALDARSRQIFLLLGAGAVLGTCAVVTVIMLLPVRRFSFRMRRRMVRTRRAGRARTISRVPTSSIRRGSKASRSPA